MKIVWIHSARCVHGLCLRAAPIVHDFDICTAHGTLLGMTILNKALSADFTNVLIMAFNATSNETVTELLNAEAVKVFVPIGVVLFFAAAVRLLLQQTMPNGPRGLTMKLELILCKDVQKQKALTVNDTEVAFAYASAVVLGIVAITAVVVFFVAIAPMAHNVGDGTSLFSSAGRGNGIGIAALVFWLVSFLTAVVLSLRTYTIMRHTYFDPNFAALIQQYMRSKRSNVSSKSSKGPAVVNAALHDPADPMLPLLALSST